jgi:hypothetical protein
VTNDIRISPTAPKNEFAVILQLHYVNMQVSYTVEVTYQGKLLTNGTREICVVKNYV